MYPWQTPIDQTNKGGNQRYRSPDQGRSASLKKAKGCSQKVLLDEMERMLIESDEEIKHLHQVIAKLRQHQRNKTLLFEAKIAELEQLNESYRLKLEAIEEFRSRRNQSMQASKTIKIPIQASERRRQNNENVNTLNIITQHCEEPSNILNTVRVQCQRLYKKVEKMTVSLNLNKLTYKSMTVLREQQQAFESEIKRRCKDDTKNPLLLLKRVQDKLNQLEKALLHDKDGNCLLSDPLMKVIKQIKAKQASLIRIPFLEKINLEERQKEYEDILSSCSATRQRIQKLIRSQL